MSSDSPNVDDDRGRGQNDALDSTGAPTWAMQPFEDFLECTSRLAQLLDLSMRGISILRGIPRVREAVAKAEDSISQPSTQQAIQNAKDEAELAQREVDEGFPILHAQAAIALWGALENAVRLFVARWLEMFPGALHVHAVQRLRVRIGEYESLQGENRFFYVLDQLERERSAPLRPGVTRFEMILAPFQLSGPVAETVRRDIFELNQLRNVLMHRGGRTDQRLVDACPWLGCAIGDAVVIKPEAFRRYFGSVHAYVVELIARVGERFGCDMSEFRTGVLQDAERGNDLTASEAPEEILEWKG